MQKKIMLFGLILLVAFSASAKCPQNKPIKIGAKCYSCNAVIYSKNLDPKSIPIMNLMEYCKNELYEFELKKAQKPTRYTVGADKKGNCPASKPLKDSMDICHSCQDPLPFAMEGENIDKCTSVCQKKSPRIRNGYFCYKQNCPKEKPILDFSGKCYSCDDKNSGIDAIHGCDACYQRAEAGMWMNKGVFGRMCSYRTNKTFSSKDYKKYEHLKTIKCPKEKPILGYSFFEKENGVCYSCYTPKVIDSVYGCDKCPNREVTYATTGSMGTYFKCSLKNKR